MIQEQKKPPILHHIDKRLARHVTTDRKLVDREREIYRERERESMPWPLYIL